MTDDIHDIVNRVVKESQQDRRKKLIASFIDSVVGSDSYREIMVNAIISNRIKDIPDADVRAEIDAWLLNNSAEVAYKWRETLRIILCQELLGSW